METAERKNDLQTLGQLLQDSLNSELAIEVPIQVKCVLQDDTLVTLAQDPNPVITEAQPIFRVLQETIEALQVAFPNPVWEQTQQVRLFLRAAGQRQPFAAHEFKLEKLPFWEDADRNMFGWEEESDDPPLSPYPWKSIFDEETADDRTEAAAASTLTSDRESSRSPWNSIFDEETADSPTEAAASSLKSEKSAPQPSRSSWNSIFDEESPDPHTETVPASSLRSEKSDTQPSRSPKNSIFDEETPDNRTEAAASTLRSNRSDAIEDLPLEEPAIDSRPDPEMPKRDRVLRRRRRQFKLPQSAYKIGVGVAAVAIVGGIYALTRPCVLGECTPIQTAKQLSRESAQTLREAKNEQDINLGKEKLSKAIQELESIPPWSGDRASAQLQLQIYKGVVTKIDIILKAMDKAKVASQKSQNPPHSVQQWQEIQSVWKEAIAAVKQIPKNSLIYPLAQQKLNEYQDNLTAIDRRVKQEQQAEIKLANGKEIAQLAEVRQGVAKTLGHWRQVESTWQAAIASLSSIPKTTTFYQEAQQLIASYQPNFAAVRDRKNQEENAAKIYNQAITIGDLAKNLEQQNQLTQAVATWRRASTYAQQVPTGTYYYSQAQPLSESYINSLRQAQAKLQVALIVQKATGDLNKTCAGVPKICDHTVNLQGIKVYLTPAYVNSVRRTAMTAGLNGDANTLAGVDDHLKTLQAALEAISENARVPLEIYDQNRALIGRYVPKPR
ncbi:hypothetical protein [Aerosakkonema funiforme]|uniref:Uncharacterized protein n=2 Tax=Oscillatoriophycideae TaxID=1301283 RepID=A0A926VC27_9CYAN|nr:hypothetical protein [Aerosakkonema funiforme]MBD2181082.1 hypothetical protein [Aerosakkonema funiforme FACHB-1375]